MFGDYSTFSDEMEEDINQTAEQEGGDDEN